jgi:hypothetical protein
MSTPIRNMTQVADSLVLKAERSRLSQDSSALEAGHSSQHGSGITDGPAFETDSPQPRRDLLISLREA